MVPFTPRILCKHWADHSAYTVFIMKKRMFEKRDTSGCWMVLGARLYVITVETATVYTVSQKKSSLNVYELTAVF